MKTLFSVRIPSICVCFTLSALFMAASDLLAGNFSGVTYLVFFLWVLICQGIDWLLCHVDFKGWKSYCLTESLLLYVLTFLFFRLIFWHSLSLRQFLWFSAVFWIVDLSVFSYFRKKNELEAEEINALLRDDKS